MNDDDGRNQYEKELLDDWKERHGDEVIRLGSGTTIDSHEIVYLIDQHLSPSDFIVSSVEEDESTSLALSNERQKIKDEIIERIEIDPTADLNDVWEILTLEPHIFVTASARDSHLGPDEWLDEAELD